MLDSSADTRHEADASEANQQHHIFFLARGVVSIAPN
jgi:hypothetical protein